MDGRGVYEIGRECNLSLINEYRKYVDSVIIIVIVQFIRLYLESELGIEY